MECAVRAEASTALSSTNHAACASSHPKRNHASAPYLWPKYEAKERRGITPDEQQSILAIEKKAEWKLFLELLWGKRPIRYGS